MRKHEQMERRFLTLSEQAFPIIEQITAGMSGSFFIYHAGGNEELIYANQALIRIYGCESLEEFKEYTGYTFPGLVHPEDVKAAERAIERQIVPGDSELDYVEYRIVRRDGEVRWIEDYGHFVHSDRYGGLFYVFVEDATEKHLKALADAQRASEAKTRFLNGISHDIRTPMNAIIGFTNLAVTHLDDQEVVRSYLSKITASSSHLLSLINDVLDMSRIESGKEEMVCYLPQVLRDLHSMVQTDLEAKGLGMSITKNLVGLMNGRIAAESEKERGIVFTLTFPFRLSAPQRSGGQRPRPAAVHRPPKPSVPWTARSWPACPS